MLYEGEERDLERLEERRRQEFGPDQNLNEAEQQIIERANNYRNMLQTTGWKQLEAVLNAQIKMLEEALSSAEYEKFKLIQQAIRNYNSIFGLIRSAINEGEAIQRELLAQDMDNQN